MIKLYGSSAAFAWGRLVFTDSKSGCFRAVLLQANGIRESFIDEKHKIRGALNEERFLYELQESGVPFEREKVVKIDVQDGVVFSGRADFVRTLPNGVLEVDELKSTESKYVLRDVIKKGTFKKEHLAQVVSYMAALKVTSGRLIYTYYEMEGEQYQPKAERAFELVIEESGTISVDGAPSKYNVQDVYRHQKLAAQFIKDNEIGPRPYNWDAKFNSPCGFCVFKEACDLYDTGPIESTEEFFNKAKILVKEKENE